MPATAPMDRLGYLGYPEDAEVDTLINQLSDETLLKMKVNSHNTSTRGFEYPTFTDGWLDDDATEALDTQLSSRFSSLKRPVIPAKKKSKDSAKVGKRGSNSDDQGGVATGQAEIHSRCLGLRQAAEIRSQFLVRRTKAHPRHHLRMARRIVSLIRGGGRIAMTGKEFDSSLSRTFSRTTSSRREDGSSFRRHPSRRQGSRRFSQTTEFFLFQIIGFCRTISRR